MNDCDNNRFKMFEHRAAALIDISAIVSNIHNIKKVLTPGTKLMAIVKADAYGHGAVQTAKAAFENGVDYFGVATEEEGVELRDAGIDAPILVLGIMPPNLMHNAVLNALELTICDYDNALLLSDICVKTGITAKIHIKLDTGMGRIGFLTDEYGLEVVSKISTLPNISITGIYTHMAQSDDEDKSFAYAQFAKFMDFVAKLKSKGVYIPIKHVSNSGAIANIREFDLDMVRAGIIIYGLKPSDYIDIKKLGLKPALEWRSYLSFVKELEKGESIGYGRTFFTTKKTTVGTVPIGYADGYSRSFSNRASVLINGKKAPVIGRVCMDQFMVDLTDITSPKAGDEVVIIGRQGEETISVDDLAAIGHTINYEIVCQISKRVKRLYKY